MIESKLLKMLYGGTTSIADFNYDMLTAPPLLSLLNPYDIEQLRQTATSITLSADINKKYEMIDRIVKARGFLRFAAGTNRLVYRHPEYPTILIKVAVDMVGMGDNPAEFKNQQYIKPFCCKVFEVSQCGTVGVFERFERITSRYEFATIAEDVFEMITSVLVGKYILEDIGTNFMYNWGIRKGFGPALLDFPYIYELDGAKIFCKDILEDGHVCGGEIDYDPGFNFLSCTKCGKSYNARELSKSTKNSGLFVQARKGAVKMKVQAIKNGVVVNELNHDDYSQIMKKPKITAEAHQIDPNNIRKKPLAVGVYGNKRPIDIQRAAEHMERLMKEESEVPDKRKGSFCGRYLKPQEVETSDGYIVDPIASMIKASGDCWNMKMNPDNSSESKDTPAEIEVKETSLEEEPVVDELPNQKDERYNFSSRNVYESSSSNDVTTPPSIETRKSEYVITDPGDMLGDYNADFDSAGNLSNDETVLSGHTKWNPDIPPIDTSEIIPNIDLSLMESMVKAYNDAKPVMDDETEEENSESDETLLCNETSESEDASKMDNDINPTDEVSAETNNSDENDSDNEDDAPEQEIGNMEASEELVPNNEVENGDEDINEDDANQDEISDYRDFPNMPTPSRRRSLRFNAEFYNTNNK